MARYWRGNKSKTIKDIEERVKKASVESVAKATQPANVHSLDDWTKFVKFSLSPAEKKRRNMYVEMWKRRVLKYCGSKKGFARIAYEMKKRSEMNRGWERCVGGWYSNIKRESGPSTSPVYYVDCLE